MARRAFRGRGAGEGRQEVDAGLGDRMLRFAVTRARAQKLKRLFVLTTQTTHWFRERGFVESDVDDLPESKKRFYNWQRRSKVLIKRCD